MKYAFLLTLLFPMIVSAGLGYSSHQSRNTVEGTLNLPSEVALINLDLVTTKGSYSSSYKLTKKIIKEVDSSLKKLGSKNIKVLTDYYSKSNYGSKKLSFLGGGGGTNVTVGATIEISFAENYNADKKIELVAKVLDSLHNFSKKIDKQDKYEALKFGFSNPVFTIKNPEQFRKKLIENVLDRSKVLADIVSKKDKKKFSMDQVSCGQKISVLNQNINLVSLNLSCNVYYKFK